MNKNSNFSTLSVMVIKEIRLERGVHQGTIAAQVGKNPNAWTKIENGQTVLTLDVMIGACTALKIHPSYLIELTEKMIPMLNGAGFFFHNGSVGNDENDLLPLILDYFNSSGYENLKSRPFDRVSIQQLSGPFGSTAVPTIVRYCCEPDFKEWVDNGAEGNMPLIPQRPGSLGWT
ncbi:TPA: helix-turn-helix transcriptional regulator [Vibrio parahaemolyticus]|uniref:helix-turn-helix domain-containing protein n=1 Tax=Vibrio diabolicus TaxID=50719 RepID=UPI0022A80B24|nr:helix-turn-helix transcriptional regulator [Vibrio diabolicus]MCZ0922655.1 helix-turn-helix transcriptional regulator [Vibrio diabolicus]